MKFPLTFYELRYFDDELFDQVKEKAQRMELGRKVLSYVLTGMDGTAFTGITLLVFLTALLFQGLQLNLYGLDHRKYDESILMDMHCAR